MPLAGPGMELVPWIEFNLRDPHPPNLRVFKFPASPKFDVFFSSFFDMIREAQKSLLLRPKRPLGANMYDFGSQVEVQNRSKIVTFFDPRANLS